MAQSQCMLEVGVLGINHKTGNLLLREMIARASDYLFFVHRIVVLSTCNRTEIYFSTPFLAEAHCDLLCALRKMVAVPFEQQLYSYFGIDCFMHLCRVTAGLDSAIIAETEIQRQVKLSYQKASLKIKLPAPLHFLFQKSLKVAKGVRSQQKPPHTFLPKILWKIIEEHFSARQPKNLNQGFISSGSAEFFERSSPSEKKKESFCKKIVGSEGDKPLTQIKILFIGNSQINREIIDFFRNKKLSRFDLCSQSIGFLDRSVLACWDDYDLIVAGTKASSYLLHPKIIEPKPRLIFDLSVPRNVDPLVGSLENVTLYNIEQIHGLVKETNDLERSNTLLRENVQRLCFSYRKRLKFRMTRIAGERDHVSDVFHSCNKEEESLKA